YEATQALRQVLNRAVAWELLRLQPGKARRSEPAAPQSGEAAIRKLAADRSGSHTARARAWADGRFRSGNRVAPRRAVCARTSRPRLQGGRGLRPSRLRERTRIACEDPAKHARGAYARDRARGPAAAAAERGPARVPELERRLHRPPQLPPAPLAA